MSLTTGSSSTTPNSPQVTKTADTLLKGLRNTYNDGVAVFDKPLYTNPSAATQNAWAQGSSFGNDIIGQGGLTAPMRSAMDSFSQIGSGFGSAASGSDAMLKPVYSGYGGFTANGGLNGAQSSAMSGLGGLGSQYAGLGQAYDPNSSAYQTLRRGISDSVLADVASLGASNGRYGSDSFNKGAAEGLGNALAGLDYSNMQNNVNNQYRSLDSQRGIFGDQFGMAQTGVGNQFAGLAGQGNTANSIFGNNAAALAGQQGAASSLFNAGQTGIGNVGSAIESLGQIGAQQDANSLAKRMANYDLFTRKNDANWEALARASSILGGTAGASGSTTSNSVPWWAALLGGAATGASILG